MTDSTSRSTVTAALEQLAGNLWWCWDFDAPALFGELSPTLWAETHHNPLQLLSRLPAADLERASSDPAWTARLDATMQRLRTHLDRPTPFVASAGGPCPERPIAYFCAEYGIHESLPLYSGGLGVLAGDHLKSASDQLLPLLAVGLFYRGGYFHQQVDVHGVQTAVEHDNDPAKMPLEPVLEPGTDKVLEIGIPMAGREVRAHAWLARVGRVALYLLDTDVAGNSAADRAITRRLYGGEEEMRIQQELVLGAGGVTLLARLGIEPAAWHMNEGHAAFLTLERAARMVAGGASCDEARETVRRTTLFTTHTPVPAGHDKFDEELARTHLEHFAGRLGLPWEEMFDLAHSAVEPKVFNMTLLGLHFASYCNGVSKLHQVASRELLSGLWPEMPENEIPVDSITNGIHLPTWTHRDISRVLGATDRAVLGRDYATAADRIDRAALWQARQPLRRHLLEVLRARVQRAPHAADLAEHMLAGLGEEPLLIGFARRFASYKRADILLSDPEHLARILGNPERPARLLIAGKAHPRDERGQAILREIVERSRQEPLRGLVFFLQDYNMQLARTLVQGVDIWLNIPRRMQEASGTSGMKAAANGGLNLSIADGWWAEAADGRNGWTIAPDTLLDGTDDQDRHDREDMFRLLDEEVIPTFFRRDAAGVPVEWLDLVCHNLATIPPVFNTDRMVAEYAERAYRPLGRAAASAPPSASNAG